MHKHIDQLCYQPDFESIEPSNNENEIVNPETLEKDIQLPQPVVILDLVILDVKNYIAKANEQLQEITLFIKN